MTSPGSRSKPSRHANSMVTLHPNAGLFTRIVRRLSVWLQPRTPQRFDRFRQRAGWFRLPHRVSPPTREQRQNWVRFQEFDHLRSLRTSALWPPQGAAPVTATTATTATATAPAASLAVAPALNANERRHIGQKIDRIEAQMTRRNPSARRSEPPAPMQPWAAPASVSEASSAADTRIGVVSDLAPVPPWPPGPSR